MSRAIPGSRLPLYVAAGALRLPVRLFAKTTAVCSAVWVSAIFAIWRFIPKTSSGHQKLLPWLITALVLFSPWLLGKTAISVFQRFRPTPDRGDRDPLGLCAL
jgi:membrane protein DedA with SNARE-associated domain